MIVRIRGLKDFYGPYNLRKLISKICLACLNYNPENRPDVDELINSVYSLKKKYDDILKQDDSFQEKSSSQLHKYNNDSKFSSLNSNKRKVRNQNQNNNNSLTLTSNGQNEVVSQLYKSRNLSKGKKIL